MKNVESMISVRVGPQQYIAKEGILDGLPILLEKEKVRSVLIVHGKKSWDKAKIYFERLFDSKIEVFTHFHQGECSDEVINLLVKKVKEMNVDAILAVGGGKIMDIVKYVAYRDGVPYYAVPTLASNCAPWTSVSVLYHPDGTFDRLDVLPKQAACLLVEPRLLFDAPREYFIAGMGDTLAKWYESNAILTQEKYVGNPMLKMARMAAAECKRTILENGIQALEDLDNGMMSPAFQAVAEVIIGISGLVGGFGDALARTTIAHEVHDALTVYPEAHNFLHGHLVGYGILVQLAVEGEWDEIKKLKEFYEPLDIPTSMAAIGLSDLKEADLRLLAAQVTQPHLPVHYLPYQVDEQVIYEAIVALESLN